MPAYHYPTSDTYRARAKAQSDQRLIRNGAAPPDAQTLGLNGLKGAQDIRQALAKAATALDYFGRAMERQQHPLHNQLSLAADIHIDLAILADAAASAVPHPKIAPILSALATAAAALANDYATRLHPRKETGHG